MNGKNTRPGHVVINYVRMENNLLKKAHLLDLVLVQEFLFCRYSYCPIRFRYCAPLHNVYVDMDRYGQLAMVIKVQTIFDLILLHVHKYEYSV